MNTRLVIFGLSVALCLGAHPGTAERAPGRQAAGTGVNLTATSVSGNESGSPVRIRILRWSTEEEGNPIVAAMNPTAPAGAASSPSAAGGRAGAARGGRGGAGRGGRGGAARGGRGDASAAPDPIAVLTAALGRAPTLGYIWTTDVTGYSIKYAYHASLPDGAERIILATDRRLGAHTTAWGPVAAAPVTDYEFTIVEIRLDSRGSGEGKASLTTKVILDKEARTIVLDDYTGTPAILRNVKR
jgi:hypothetical protein